VNQHSSDDQAPPLKRQPRVSISSRRNWIRAVVALIAAYFVYCQIQVVRYESLYSVVCDGDVAKTRELVKGGLDPNSLGYSDFDLPLNAALLGGDRPMVQVLVELGANPDQMGVDETPRSIAKRLGRLDWLKGVRSKP
jgi:hypothetical protein